jgi:hypothetical protein
MYIVSEFSFDQMVSFSAKNCTIKLVFRYAFFFTSYYTVFRLMVIFQSHLVIFQCDSVVFHSFMVIFQCDSVVFHPVMVIFQCNSVVFHPVMVIFQCNSVVFHSVMVIFQCDSVVFHSVVLAFHTPYFGPGENWVTDLSRLFVCLSICVTN